MFFGKCCQNGQTCGMSHTRIKSFCVCVSVRDYGNHTHRCQNTKTCSILTPKQHLSDRFIHPRVCSNAFVITIRFHVTFQSSFRSSKFTDVWCYKIKMCVVWTVPSIHHANTWTNHNTQNRYQNCVYAIYCFV